MDLVQKMQLAIKNNDESTIDTLLFISKIESLKSDKNDNNPSYLFNSIQTMVKDFYKSKYKIPYSKEAVSLYGYIGKEIDKEFYNLNEINLENRELLTDKIIKRMKQIKNSSCSFEYKFNSLILLHDYLEELSPLENHIEADVLLRKMICKKILMNIIMLFFFSLPLWLPNVTYHLVDAVDGHPKELIYYSLMMKVVNLLVYGTAFLFLHFKGIFKKQMIYALVTLFVFTSLTVPNYITDIQTPISQYTEETVKFYSITQSPNNKEAKFAVIEREKGQKESYLFHTDLALDSSKTYTIKYNKTNIVVEANEVQHEKLEE